MGVCNPKIQISYSDDGGYNWSTPRYIEAGPIGGYNFLCRAWRLGQSRNRVYKVVYTEPTPFALFGAELDLEPTKGTT